MKLSVFVVSIFNLNSFVSLMHELKQLVDDRLEEPPVRPQESRILSDDVHDVGRDDRLVVLPLLLLAKAKQILKRKQLILIKFILENW